MVYVRDEFINVDESDNNPTAALQGNAEKFKTEFTCEMAQMMSQITNIEKLELILHFYTVIYTTTL